jgi:hypothetical protein
MMAASDGLLETVKLLVLKGADMKKTAKGLTALDLAAFNGHEKVASQGYLSGLCGHMWTLLYVFKRFGSACNLDFDAMAILCDVIPI